jgi:hypothetical protein
MIILVLNIIYHIFFILTVLGIVFYSVGIEYEKSVVTKFILTSLTPDFDKNNKGILSKTVKENLINTGLPSTCLEYKQNSTKLIFISVYITSLLITISITIVASYYISLPMLLSIIFENIIIFMIIIVFELIFFNYIVTKYAIINYDELINIIRKSVIKYIK